MDETPLNAAHRETADVTICTASISHRHEFLAENMESVRNQTVTPKAHLIGIDYARVGGQRMMNNLIRAADTTWVVPLADDDLLYPEFLETLLNNSEGADLIYPYCDVSGRGAWNPSADFDAERLRKGPYIPATVLLRKSVWEELSGFSEVEVCEDYAFQMKMLNANKVFKCVPKKLWLYRFAITSEHNNISDGKVDPWLI